MTETKQAPQILFKNQFNILNIYVGLLYVSLSSAEEMPIVFDTFRHVALRSPL